MVTTADGGGLLELNLSVCVCGTHRSRLNVRDIISIHILFVGGMRYAICCLLLGYVVLLRGRESHGSQSFKFFLKSADDYFSHPLILL